MRSATPTTRHHRPVRPHQARADRGRVHERGGHDHHRDRQLHASRRAPTPAPGPPPHRTARPEPRRRPARTARENQKNLSFSWSSPSTSTNDVAYTQIKHRRRRLGTGRRRREAGRSTPAASANGTPSRSRPSTPSGPAGRSPRPPPSPDRQKTRMDHPAQRLPDPDRTHLHLHAGRLVLPSDWPYFTCDGVNNGDYAPVDLQHCGGDHRGQVLHVAERHTWTRLPRTPNGTGGSIRIPHRDVGRPRRNAGATLHLPGGRRLAAPGPRRAPQGSPAHRAPPDTFGRLSREVRAWSRARHGNHHAILKEI